MINLRLPLGVSMAIHLPLSDPGRSMGARQTGWQTSAPLFIGRESGERTFYSL